ncbi:hypothetical protein J2S08_003162 [Bacillus chungangensis]|uniref:Argininosuccinate lyase n=1 Tax=Bacillus chungangensis TaxID=587633 RepID=A0ABT9WVF5_9BACI|nr:hypothetical protein [Bacillus chungangensis]
MPFRKAHTIAKETCKLEGELVDCTLKEINQMIQTVEKMSINRRRVA